MPHPRSDCRRLPGVYGKGAHQVNCIRRATRSGNYLHCGAWGEIIFGWYRGGRLGGGAAMKKTAWLWYLLVAVVALTPAGLRALTWHRAKPQPVDVNMAQAGEELFKHDWKKNDLLTTGDGLGPVFNATSCAA